MSKRRLTLAGLAAILCLALGPLPMAGQPGRAGAGIDADALDRYLMGMLERHVIPGLAVAITVSVQLTFTPDRAVDSNYGFGWEINRYYGEPQITHGGDTERFHTAVVLLPERGFGLIVLINDNHLLKDYNECNALVWSLVGLVTGRPLPPEPLSSMVYGWALLGVWLSSLGPIGYRLVRLTTWRATALSWSRRRRWLDIGQHAGWVAVTVLAVTVIGPGLLGRGFNWNWFAGLLPDVALVTLTLVAGDLALLSLTLVLSTRSRDGVSRSRAARSRPVGAGAGSAPGSCRRGAQSARIRRASTSWLESPRMEISLCAAWCPATIST